MHPEIIELNANRLQVTYHKLPWLQFCIVWAGLLLVFCAMQLIFSGGWFYVLFIAGWLILAIYLADRAANFSKKEIIIFDCEMKEIYKNNSLYKKYDEIVGFSMTDPTPGELSDDYTLWLNFSSGSLNLGSSSSRLLLLERRKQINRFIDGVASLDMGVKWR